MRARALLLGAILIGVAMPSFGEEGVKMEQRTRRVRGAGGDLAVSLLPSRSSPLVTFRVQFRVGSIDDPATLEGLNALTALTIGKGGTPDHTFREVTDLLFPMAASINVQPDHEVTTFLGEVHRDYLAEFQRLFISLLLQPRFDEDDFTRNRDLLVAAIETNLRSNDDESLGKAALEWSMYPGHPYRRLNIGTVEGLKKITLDDVKRHYRTHYTQKTIRIGLAGGYPPRLVESLKEDLSRLPDSLPRRPELPEPPVPEGMEVLLVEKPVPAVAISMGYPIDVTRADKDFYALMVANSYLGEHRTFNGRLMNKMRGERGLNYGDYSYIETFIQDGGSTFPLPNTPRRQQSFTIWIRPVAPPNAMFALRQATRELQRLVDQGLTKDEFEQTRKFLLNYSRLWVQSLSRRLGYQMDSDFYGTGFVIDEIQKALPRLTVEDVNAAVKKHLNARNIKVAIVTDRAEELRKVLLSGDPTPITYQTPTTTEALLREDKEIESYSLPINKERVTVIDVAELFQK